MACSSGNLPTILIDTDERQADMACSSGVFEIEGVRDGRQAYMACSSLVPNSSVFSLSNVVSVINDVSLYSKRASMPARSYFAATEDTSEESRVEVVGKSDGTGESHQGDPSSFRELRA